jgi:hypothetical protein
MARATQPPHWRDPQRENRPPQKHRYFNGLLGAGQILLFGAGTGASSAMEQLIANLSHHHADVARRIVGSIAVDEHHLTEDELLARAREFYGSALNAQDS